MNSIHSIRRRLGCTQTELAKGLGCTQGNVGHYERGAQTMPPHVARRLIAFARERGHAVTFDEIYAADADDNDGAAPAADTADTTDTARAAV